MFIRINAAIEASRLKREENEKGFTLIELLVVVLIIGVLSAIAIPIFLGQQQQAKDAAVESDLATSKIAYVSYLVENPTGLADGTTTAPQALLDFGWISGVRVKTGGGTAFCLDLTKDGTTGQVTASGKPTAGPLCS